MVFVLIVVLVVVVVGEQGRVCVCCLYDDHNYVVATEVICFVVKRGIVDLNAGVAERGQIRMKGCPDFPAKFEHPSIHELSRANIQIFNTLHSPF